MRDETKAGQKYTINQQTIETILTWIRTGEIAIPEIQRPFVWKAAKVRDLMDSLYNGYPVGYLITWRNPDVKLKDGSSSVGKKVLIDGQQRLTALNAAVLGEYVVDSDYKKRKIQIAYQPLEEKFEVHNPAIEKDKEWLPDIAEIVNGGLMQLTSLVATYCQENNADEDLVFERLDKLRKIKGTQLGLIDLDANLDIETVTEIFIRINSEGVVLSQADFVMSKIASNEYYDGINLRKAIDYFCHLAMAPEHYAHIKDNDPEFAKTEYFRQMAWLKNENDALYDPSYTDLIRVAFTSQFDRGKLSDLVSLLSGRNFETRTFEEEIAAESFEKLKAGVRNFSNQTNFKRLIMIIKSAGFIVPDMIRSMNALNFAYILYLKLRDLNYAPNRIEHYVRRWYVLSVLTGRYSGSAESRFDYDIKQVSNRDFGEYLRDNENAELSDAYWNAALVQNLNTSVASSPYFHVYLATQVKKNNNGFLSKEITVKDLITHRGDIHHVFPRNYLKKHGLTRGKYNQIANYVYMQSEINIRIGNKAPNRYFDELLEQCNGGEARYGGIQDLQLLKRNLKMNCIPQGIFNMDIKDYEDFLMERRVLISNKIRDYYFSL
jgi:hypothetical protein